MHTFIIAIPIAGLLCLSAMAACAWRGYLGKFDTPMPERREMPEKTSMDVIEAMWEFQRKMEQYIK